MAYRCKRFCFDWFGNCELARKGYVCIFVWLEGACSIVVVCVPTVALLCLSVFEFGRGVGFYCEMNWPVWGSANIHQQTAIYVR